MVVCLVSDLGIDLIKRTPNVRKLALLFLLSFCNVQAMEQKDSEPQEQNEREKLFYFISSKLEETDKMIVRDITTATQEGLLQIKAAAQSSGPSFSYKNYDVYLMRHKSRTPKFNSKQCKSFIQCEIDNKEIQNPLAEIADEFDSAIQILTSLADYEESKHK